MKNLNKKNSVKTLFFIVLFLFINIGSLFAEIRIAGNYSGIASTGKLVAANVRVYSDGITVTAFGQTAFMSKFAEGMYINQQGEKIYFDQGKMFVVDINGNSYFLVRQN